jgi:glycosyltransferase involved in cell wall biosynthesis
MTKKVLYVLHNHPAVMPGGAETYALELYRAMRDSGPYETILLARTGPPVSRSGRVHEGTLLEPVGEDPGQYFFHTDIEEYDWFLSTSGNKAVYTRFYRDFLRAFRPDVVHFQHTLFLGYDILRETRRTLPDAAIVYTLHEYLPICHNNGQMFRTTSERCTEASPRRCHECFPEVSPQQFFLRERFIKSHLSVVDKFIAPSHFLRDRYVEWGIAPERIDFEENGRPAMIPLPMPERREARPRTRIGYFGQFTAFKGADVLLQAMAILAERRSGAKDEGAGSPRPELRLHGANIEHQPTEFRELFASLLADSDGDVTLFGRYLPHELPALMRDVDWVVVPSIWWENSPLVIQEAFGHGRPVICSDIGGMAEKVRDGVDGLHFRAGDATSLADTIARATETPGLWEELRAGAAPVYPLDRHVASLTAIYDQILAAKRHTSTRVGARVAVGTGGAHAD